MASMVTVTRIVPRVPRARRDARPATAPVLQGIAPRAARGQRAGAAVWQHHCGVPGRTRRIE